MNDELAEIRTLMFAESYRLANIRLESFLKSNAHSGEGHSLRALCLHNLGKELEAEDEARLGTTIAPQEDYGYFVLSYLMYERADYGASLTAIEKAIKLYPERADYWVQKAKVELARRRWGESLESSQVALGLIPNFPPAMQCHVEALQKLGRVEEATELSDKLPVSYKPHDVLRKRQLSESGLYQLVESYERFKDEVSPRFDYLAMLTTAIATHFAQRLLPHPKGIFALYTLVTIGFLWIAYLNWIFKPIVLLLLDFSRRGRTGLSRDEHYGVMVLVAILMMAALLMTGQFTIPDRTTDAVVCCLMLAVPGTRIFQPRVDEARWCLLSATLVVFLAGVVIQITASYLGLLKEFSAIPLLSIIASHFWITVAGSVLLAWLFAPDKGR